MSVGCVFVRWRGRDCVFRCVLIAGEARENVPSVLRLRQMIDRCGYVLSTCFLVLFLRSAHHILLELEVSPLDKSAELEVTLRTDNVGKEQRLRL